MNRKRAFILLFSLLGVLILLAGYLYFWNQASITRIEKQKELTSIAELKISQISDWYLDELNDAKVISENNFLLEKIENSLLKRNKKDEIALRYLITSFKNEHGYEDILLASPEGKILLNAKDTNAPADSTLLGCIHELTENRSTISTDLYWSSGCGRIFIDFLSPVFDTAKNIHAVLIFRKDPEQFLYPLVESWPYTSKTSESLLVKKDNDSVLFLNELRFKSNSALRYRIPLTSTDLPAVQAVLGRTGIFDGIDYRGVKVMSYMSPIPGTQWFLAAKVDKTELFAIYYKLFGLALLLLVVILLLLVLGLALYTSNTQRNVYRTLLQTQEEFRTTLYSIGDGVITTDENELILHVNPVAEQLLGWKEKESKGKLSAKIIHLIDENTRKKIEDPFQKILKEKHVVAFTSHTLLVTKNGEEIPISLSGAPIKDKNKQVRGVVLVIRDQTEERKNQRLVEENERRFAAFMNYLPALVLIKDTELRPIYANARYKELFPVDRWFGKTPEETFPPEISNPMRENDLLAIKNGYISYEEQWEDKNGVKYIFETHKFRIDRFDKDPYLGAIILDITSRKKTELSLARERQLLESLITSIPDNIYFKDTQSRFIGINNSMAKIFGLNDPSDAYGKTDFDFFDNEHAEQAFQDEQHIISTGIPIIGKEEKETWPDGRINWVSTTKVPLKDESGKITGIIGISRDITKSKSAENALRISEERYKLVSELTSDYTYKIDVDLQGHLTMSFVSESFNLITGRNLSQVNAMENWNNYFYPDDLGLMKKFVADLINTKQGGELECRTYIQDNQLRWVNITAKPILDSEQKRVVSIIGSVKDISERKQAEKALRESEEIFRNFMEHSPVYVFFKDENIRTLKLSKNFEQMLGLPIDEMLGKTMDELFPSDLAKSMIEDDKSILKEGRLVVVDEELNGRFYTTIKYPIQIDENTRYLAGFTIDITEKKKAEEALLKQNAAIEKQNEEYASLNKVYQVVNEELRKSNAELLTARDKAEESDRLKSAFLANMSHEIRTPMNAIIGFSDLISEANLSKEKLHQYTHTIKHRSYDLLALINDILDISKIEAGQMNIIENEGDLEELITDVFNTFKTLWCDSGKSKINFRYSYGLSAEESMIVTDFGRVRQVLTNLVGNAFKFTKEGSITIGCQRKNHKFIQFNVTDTGIGISPEKQSLIFDRFRQAEETHSQLFGGTGLGLSISKGIVELLDGSIWIESEPGKGSSFYFTIPYVPVTKKHEARVEFSMIANRWENERILLVEDDEYNTEYLREALRETGIQITQVGNGHEAIELIERDKSFNLVLLDLRLPDIEGFEVAQQIKLQQPELPIIAQTAYASENYRSRSMEAGCSDYIMKPIKQKELLDSIAHFLKKN
jgi:PAS domain S-box-containing protein